MTKYKYELHITSDDEEINENLEGSYDSLEELKSSLQHSLSIVGDHMAMPVLNLTHFRRLFDSDVDNSTTIDEPIVSENDNIETYIPEKIIERQDDLNTESVQEIENDEEVFEDDEDKDFEFSQDDSDDENVTDDFDGMI